MFETSVVRARVAQRRYSLLSVSLAAHSLVIIAVLAASISSTSFPKAPPAEYQVFYKQAPPPPPSAAPHQPVPQPAQTHAAAVPNAVIPSASLTPMTLTPNKIPETIPIVPQSSSIDLGTLIGNTAVSGTGSGSGDVNGVDNGQASTDVPPAADTVFHPGAEVKPAVVVHRVEPQYPRGALQIHMAGIVVLKCIVDKNGNVRDAEVVTSSFAAFNEPALNALQQWRFTPGSFRGKPVDTWFELTIRFQPR